AACNCACPTSKAPPCCRPGIPGPADASRRRMRNAPQCGASSLWPWTRCSSASSRRSIRLSLHRGEELVVALGALHLVEQELHRADLVHAVQQLAQDPDLLQ